jgi:hypothetical protein
MPKLLSQKSQKHATGPNPETATETDKSFSHFTDYLPETNFNIIFPAMPMGLFRLSEMLHTYSYFPRVIVILIVIYSKFNQIQYTGHTTTGYRMSQVLLNNVPMGWN